MQMVRHHLLQFIFNDFKQCDHTFNAAYPNTNFKYPSNEFNLFQFQDALLIETVPVHLVESSDCLRRMDCNFYFLSLAVEWNNLRLLSVSIKNIKNVLCKLEDMVYGTISKYYILLTFNAYTTAQLIVCDLLRF